MNPPPPMLPAVGWTTASAKAVATAASMALPPSRIASAPIVDATSLCDATMPRRAVVGTDPAWTDTVRASAVRPSSNRFMAGLYGLALPRAAPEQNRAHDRHQRRCEGNRPEDAVRPEWCEVRQHIGDRNLE